MVHRLLWPAGRAYWKLVALLRHPGRFGGSRDYWRQRYRSGGRSGPGSAGALAAFKAEILNGFVARERVRSVIEFGCGDGEQLRRARYPAYLAYDVSAAAVARCRRVHRRNPRMRFHVMRAYAGERAELALSLDVIYHLVEDDVYEAHMRRLFDAATRHVIIYSSDTDDNRGFEGTHIRHRRFTDWVARHRPDWRLDQRIPNRHRDTRFQWNGSFADFFLYGRIQVSAVHAARRHPRG
jgi:hypothetical protein